MEPIKPQEPILNNYSNKSIQFYKKDNRYILIFADVFFPSSKEDFVIADLYKDLQEAKTKMVRLTKEFVPNEKSVKQYKYLYYHSLIKVLKVLSLKNYMIRMVY